MRPLLLALLLTLGSFAAYGQSPDCQFTQTFTATGYGVTVSNQAVANLGTQCTTWRLSYYADGMTALSIQIEGAPDASGAPGTFAAVPTTACSSTVQPPCTLDGANPLTDPNHATEAFRGYYAWIALDVTIFTPTGTSGSITARMYGYKGTSPSASIRGGTGGSGITALTGDVTATGPGSAAASVVKINGGNVPASAHLLGTNGSSQPIVATATDLSATVYVAGGGIAQAQTVTLAPAVTALTNGLASCWLPVAANTAAAPTLKVNATAAKPITKLGTTALVANDLTTTAVACAIYDGTEFQLQNPQTASSGGPAYYQTVDNAATPLPQEPALNFAGSGVSCVDNSGATRTDCTISGAAGTPGATVFSSTTTAGPNNSASETSLIGTVTGSKTIAANTFTNGAVLQAHAQGFFSLPAVSDSLTLKMKCGTTVIGSAVLTPAAGLLTDGSWRFWLDIAARGTGTGGAFITNGFVELTGSALTDTTAKVLNTTTVAFDFTTACVFDVTAKWGAAQVGETFQGTNGAAWFPGGSSGSGGGGMVQIAQIVTASSATSVDFSSIPGTYTNLEIVLNARTTAITQTVGLNLKVNNDGTGGDYQGSSYQLWNPSLNTGTVGAGTDGAFVFNIPGSSMLAGVPGAVIVNLPSYAQTTFNKPILVSGSYPSSGSDVYFLTIQANWLSTTAITDLTFSIGGSAFVDGSTFTLYGMQ